MDWVLRRMKEIEEIADLPVVMLGGCPFLLTGDGKIVPRISGDIDLVADPNSERCITESMLGRGYRVVKREYALSGTLVDFRRGDRLISLYFHPFYEEVWKYPLFFCGGLLQVFKEWDYTFVSFIWRGIYEKRLLSYMKSGLIDPVRLRDMVTISPYRELIASTAPHSLKGILPHRLLGYRMRGMMIPAFLKALYRVARRRPRLAIEYVIRLNPRRKLRYLREMDVDFPQGR